MDGRRDEVRREVKQAQGCKIVSPVQNAPLVAKWAQLIYANLSGQVPTRLGVAVRAPAIGGEVANIHLRSTFTTERVEKWEKCLSMRNEFVCSYPLHIL